MNLPQQLKDAVPITPPQTAPGDFERDELAEYRCFRFSYLNDIFPEFQMGLGLLRNRDFSYQQPNYGKEKFPRRLVITIEGQDFENI